MKAVAIVLAILSSAMILFNIPVYIAGFKPKEVSGFINILAYYIGLNSGFILGFIFFLISYRIFKRLKQKKAKIHMQEMIESIGKIDE